GMVAGKYSILSQPFPGSHGGRGHNRPRVHNLGPKIKRACAASAGSVGGIPGLTLLLQNCLGGGACPRCPLPRAPPKLRRYFTSTRPRSPATRRNTFLSCSS